MASDHINAPPEIEVASSLITGFHDGDGTLDRLVTTLQSLPHAA